MTNQELIKNWKSYSVLLDEGDDKGPHSLEKCFMVCWGETTLNEGKPDETKVVIFDTGGAMGSPSMWCHSNENDELFEFFWDEKTGSHVGKKTGKFIKV